MGVKFSFLRFTPFFNTLFLPKPQPTFMLNKNSLLALLALWLLGSAWWQTSKIMNCSAPDVEINTDSLNLADSLANLPAIADTILTDTAMVVPATGASEDDLAKNEKYTSVFKPMNLYFRTSDANYIKTDENQKFLDEAKAYLAANPDKSLSLTGHTDSDGGESANQKLSERRSSDVKNQLVGKGFTATQLSTDAKGETKPIASNDTQEGKKANRRVTIVVNQ